MALRLMFQMYMRPRRFTVIIDTVRVTMMAIPRLNPSRIKVTINIAAVEKRNLQLTSYFAK